MRNLVFAINLSLDGCCDHSKMSGDEEIFEYFTKLMRKIDLLVYGRKTYQLMVPFWPDFAKNHSAAGPALEFAQSFDAIPKLVFSRSSDVAVGSNTRIASANLQDEILKLKLEPGKNILTGGVDLPSQLIELGLVDEYHFVIHPVVVGEGRRLLDHANLPEKSQLKLVQSRTCKSGIVALHYSTQ